MQQQLKNLRLHCGCTLVTISYQFLNYLDIIGDSGVITFAINENEEVGIKKNIKREKNNTKLYYNSYKDFNVKKAKGK